MLRHFMRVEAEAEFINNDFISEQNIKNCLDSMRPSKQRRSFRKF